VGISGAIALYFVVWWLTLFAMLPIGVRSQHEGDTSKDEIVEGADPGAPRLPMMGKKLIWTTLAAIPVTALLFAWLTLMD
jgi:predicted secreted protein